MRSLHRLRHLYLMQQEHSCPLLVTWRVRDALTLSPFAVLTQAPFTLPPDPALRPWTVDLPLVDGNYPGANAAADEPTQVSSSAANTPPRLAAENISAVIKSASIMCTVSPWRCSTACRLQMVSCNLSSWPANGCIRLTKAGVREVKAGVREVLPICAGALDASR